MAYEYIQKTAPHAITCHAKTEIPGPSGKEIADFEKIADILEKSGYKGYLSIEYEAAEDPMTAVPKFVSSLKEVV
jgi:hydroxypyruvate isomerase